MPSPEMPLSVGQEGLWRLRRGMPGRGGFSVGRALRLRSPDVGLLELALGEVVARQAALRTRFAERDGEPVRVVEPVGPVGPVGLERLGSADAIGAAAEVAAAFVERPFDLGRGPLWRAGLIRLGAGEHLLVLAADALVCDAWSLRLWVTELGLAYQELAGRDGSSPVLSPLPVGYGDFVLWQRDAVARRAFDGQVGYWRERLAAGAPLELPCDRVRPTRETGAGAAHAFVVPAGLLARVRALAVHERSTVFMVLLAAFKVLLARSSGQDDVAVGSLAPGRGWPELENVIGLFENPVVLRTDLSGDPSFVELLGRVREIAVGAFSHQDLPFEVLFEALVRSGGPPRYPLFQVVFTLVGGQTPAGMARLGATEVPLAWTTTRWDLSLELVENDEELRGMVRSSTELFEPATARRLVERYLALLSSSVADPRQPLARLEPR